MRSRALERTVLTLLLGLSLRLSSAQENGDIPPQTRVVSASSPLRAARLTFLAGAVQIQRNDNTAEESAVLNMPLSEGTRILTGDYGEAEIEFEDGSVARLTPRSALSLDSLALDPGQVAHTEFSLLGGLAYFELRKSSSATWLVNAGGTRATPIENVVLRASLEDPAATFSVLAGSAEVERAEAFAVEVRAGESLRPDEKDRTRYFLSQQTTEQSWDAWNTARDQAAADAADRRTAARSEYSGAQGYGWADLDANGSWYNVPGSGFVWQPDNADEGFDPYGYGNWVWGSGSYVWASGYSWGWTPYRCGHWQFFSGFGWGWMPDVSCGRWGFAGGGAYGAGDAGGIFIRGNYPPRHNPVVRPQPRPGGPHPVVPVRGPDGPRPPTVHRGQVRIAGTTVAALPVIVPAASRSGNSVGQTLTRDFPIDRATHQPVLGIVSGTTGPGGGSAPMTGSHPPHVPAGTIPADAAARPGRDRDTIFRPSNDQPVGLGRIAPSTRAPERPTAPSLPSASPGASPVAPPPRYTPPPVQPPPVHPNPPPVRYSPPPPAPAPPPPARPPAAPSKPS